MQCGYKEELLIIVGRMLEEEDTINKDIGQYDLNHPYRVLNFGYIQGVRRWRIALQDLLNQHKEN